MKVQTFIKSHIAQNFAKRKIRIYMVNTTTQTHNCLPELMKHYAIPVCTRDVNSTRQTSVGMELEWNGMLESTGMNIE